MAHLYGLTEVIPGLYISSGNAAANEQNIVKNKISLIVNATPNLPEPEWAQVHRVKHKRVPLKDRPDSDLKRYFDTIADIIEGELSIKGHVLVHCVMGASRSATLIMVYLMKYKRYPLKQAFLTVHRRREIINPNVGFWRQMIKFEDRIFRQNTVKMVSSPRGVIPDIYLMGPQS